MASIPEPREDYLIRRADSDDEIFWSGMNSKARFGSMYIKVGYADHTVLEIRFKLGYAEILNVKTGYIVKSLKMGEFVRNCILRGAGYSKIENKSRLLELIYNEMHSLKPENNKYALLCGKIWNNFWLDWKDNIFGADNESEARLRSGAIYADSSKISFKMTINKEFVFENKYFSFSNPKMVATFKNAPTEDLFGMLDVARQSGMELKSLDFLPDNAQYIASKKFDHDTQSIWIKNDELILEISSKIRDPKVVGLVKDILTNKQDVEELKEVLQCKSLRLENNVRKIEDIKAFLKEKNHRIAEKMASITGISNITVSNLVVPYSGLDKSSYPNRFLVTGSDILFFWVSKMIQANLALGEMPSPFKEVYLHGLVQDECGKKMSKSKGNVINPLELFDEQGVDVVRFSMLNAATAGRNVRFGSANIDKSRKFLIKIWNGMSCCINNIDNPKLTQDRFNMQEILKSPANKWILSLIYQLDHKINNKFDKWDVYGATEAVYSFFWDRFCSEYIEVSKYLLKTEAKDETRFVMQVACAKLMQILLPFVPAISQHFWNKLADFQIYDRIACYFHEDLEFEKTLQIGRNIRSLAKNFQLSNEVQITIDKECDTNLLSAFTRLKVVFGAPNTAIFAMDGVQISFGEIDGLQDKKSKILQSIEEEIALLRSKLNDDGFVKNADAQEVANYKSRLEELEKDKKVYE
jgi:hypothetical protein